MTTEDMSLECELRFHDPVGWPRRWTVRYEPDSIARESGVFSGMVTSSDGGTGLRKWVPAELMDHSPGVCQSLENEVRAGMRLFHRYGEHRPAELSGLFGCDLLAPEPFVLITPPRGRPVAELDPLLLDERNAFQISLLRAVLLLGEAGVVHTNLTARTVRWDGSTVWVGDFGCAAAVGDRDVSLADDVWAAGKVILWMADRRDDLTDLAHRGDAMRTLLDGVFAEDPEARPPATELLRRLGADPTVPPPDPVTTRAHTEGGAEFDRVLARKWPPRPPAAAPVPQTRRPGWLARTDAVAVVIIAGVAAFVILVLLLWRPW